MSSWNSGTTLRPSMYSINRLENGTGFSFIDFLPEIQEPGGFLKRATFEKFSALVDRANDWLRKNRKWKITTCESVEFKKKGQEVDSSKMKYLEYGDTVTSYVRGLRLWLTEREYETERAQQIGYMNIIPQKLDKSGFFGGAKYEALDSVLERFNSMLESNPLPGRVITIESQEMKMSHFHEFDPDRTSWSVNASSQKHFVFVLRVFYESMESLSETIGIKDFIPDVIRKGGVITWPEYEPFSTIVQKASSWWKQQRELRFCNAQSLEIKVKRGKDVNTQKMDFTERGSYATSTFYVRILRVAYTKSPANLHFHIEKPPPISELTCKTFIPVELTTGLFVPNYENLFQTKERVIAWVKATNARVVNAETAALRIKSGGERKDGEATYIYNRTERSEYWIFVIRLYLNGVYREPPPEMLPPLPEPSSGCCIIL